jgi:tRNA pseudouridine(38-40) synthase
LRALVKVTGCGRTDAGVHALRYCANFRTDSTIPTDRLPLAVNSRLPADIAVTDAVEAAEDFNAIGSCLKKEYIYRIMNTRIRDPFLQNRVCFYPAPLDIGKMSRAAAALRARTICSGPERRNGDEDHGPNGVLVRGRARRRPDHRVRLCGRVSL